MLERAGGGMRASIQTENLYERRLLTEVHSQPDWNYSVNVQLNVQRFPCRLPVLRVTQK